MYLHNMTRGTSLEITLGDGREVHSAYDGNIDHMTFYVLCPEILKNIEELTGTQVNVKFHVNNTDYTFTAGILGKSTRTDALHETMDFKVLTAFKETPRRDSFRINMQIKVRIHYYIDDYTKFYTGDWVCDAITVDVNKNGIRIFSDYCLEPEAMYTLEFELRTGWRNLIPSKLIRHEPNTTTRSYAYDYVFLFDFGDAPEKREKLFLDIMEAKMRGTVR
ncbi:MAG: hypothetical protein FWB91_09435 [Defluviitaleaceae bacterium]|nr:hypothetical protein [Defluviitaleaceae bacterium]